MSRIRFALVVGALVAFGVCASVAAADNGHGPIKGIVPSRGQKPDRGASSSNPLIYNGGSVLSTNTVYAIYWSPAKYPIASSYEALIDRFYGDVAAATTAGATNDVYHVDTQYGAGITGSSAVTPNSMSNASSFGGSFVDTSPLPASGCRDHYTRACVTDAQIVQEVQKDIGASKGWSNGQPTAGGNHIFFMFTAKGVGSCYPGGGCSFSQWCAYHSSSGSLLYANMPFADTVSSACDAGYHPNSAIDPNADATINVASHEHNETITDPFGSAWFDNSGNEIGDKCAWTFGSVSADQANQTINGDPYILQQEYSNYNGEGCVLQGP